MCHICHKGRPNTGEERMRTVFSCDRFSITSPQHASPWLPRCLQHWLCYNFLAGSQQERENRTVDSTKCVGILGCVLEQPQCAYSIQHFFNTPVLQLKQRFSCVVLNNVSDNFGINEKMVVFYVYFNFTINFQYFRQSSPGLLAEVTISSEFFSAYVLICLKTPSARFC